MKKILFIVPSYNTATNLTSFHKYEFINRKCFAPPLHLATLAALTPDSFETEIWDENVKGLCSDAAVDFDCDLVAITGFINHLNRQKKVSAYFRERGIPVAVGGVGVSSSPERYKGFFDYILTGEAELIWREFLNDFEAGKCKEQYNEQCSIDMTYSPMPKWDSIAGSMSGDYVLGLVQSTRGCPFSCEFCTIWTNFGRKVRTKPIEQVLLEIVRLYEIGFREILFANDNFAGNMRYSKELMRAIIKLQNELPEKIRFFAEISINIARDDEFLELMAQSNFRHLLVGLETPNLESLKETHKGQNMSSDLAADCRKVQSYGMSIEGSMIVGFDNDTPDIFDMQFDFIQKANLPIVKMHLLKANPGSALIDRLKAEGRLITELDIFDEFSELDTEAVTNVMPKNMSRTEMLEGYIRLLERLAGWDDYLKRLENFILGITHPAVYIENGSEIEDLVPSLKKVIDSIDYRAAEKAEELMKLALKRCPKVINDVATMILRHQLEFDKLPKLVSDIRKTIEIVY